jgi:hypothetical protein
VADSSGLLLAFGSVAALALGGQIYTLLAQGSGNEDDAVREGLSILSEYPDRMAASYRTVMEAKGKRARAGAVLREGGSSAARALFDNARVARAYLKK